MRLTELKCWGGRDGYLVWELRYYHATTEFLLKREGIIAFSPRNRPSLLLVQDIYPAQGGWAPGKLDTKIPITFTTCLIVGICVFKGVAQTDRIRRTFSSVSVTVIAIEFNTNPEKVNFWEDMETEFSEWIWNPNLVNSVMVSMTFLWHSAEVSPCRWESSIHPELHQHLSTRWSVLCLGCNFPAPNRRLLSWL